MIVPLLWLVLAYLIGAIPFGYLMVRWKTGQDVRTMGSGNIGATNVLRTTGRAVGVVTLVLDIAKGYLAVWLMAKGTGNDLAWMSAAAVAVMLGHGFPIFLRFQGGKAVASFVGAFLYLTPAPLLACLLIFVVVVGYSRYVSLGSVIAAGLLPIGVWMILRPIWPVTAAAAFSGAFIIWRHRANLGRIRSGKENVFSFKGKKK